jgi:hypothetical protein
MKEFSLIYFILYGFFAFFALLFALKVDVRQKQAQTIGTILTIFLVSILVFLFGMRGPKIGTDTLMYRFQFMFYKKLDFGAEFMISWLMATIHLFTPDPQVYIFSLSAIFLVVLLLASYHFAKHFHYNVFFILFSFVSLYFFQSLGINIVRQGVALAFLLLAFSLYLKYPTQFYRWIIPIVLAFGFHITSVVVLLVFILVKALKKIDIKYYTLLYFVFVLLSFFKISVLSLGSVFSNLFQGDRRNGYLDGSMAKEFEVGFKPQFVVFNTVFMILFFLLRKYGQKQEQYDVLFKTYIGISCLFFMMFQIPYSDRWGIMSWSLIPFLFAPAFAENGQYKTSTAAVLVMSVLFIIFQTMYYKP